MAESTQRSSSKAKVAKAREEAEDADAQAQGTDPDAQDTSEHHPAPAPQDPTAAGRADAGEAVEDPDAPFAKDLLISMGDQLLGYDPAVVRGVLAGAPDELSVAEAKSRIDSFLSATVTRSTTDEEA